MIDVRTTMQTVLDNALKSAAVRVFWLRKTDTTSADPDEYVVYTQDGNTPTNYADDAELVRSTNIVVQYHYHLDLIDTQAGRTAVKTREQTILTALKNGGFSVFNGPFDAGDIDDTGYGTTIYECYFDEVV